MLWFLILFIPRSKGAHEDSGFSQQYTNISREAYDNDEFENYFQCLTLVKKTYFFTTERNNFESLFLWTSSYLYNQIPPEKYDTIQGSLTREFTALDNAYSAYFITSDGFREPPFVAAHKQGGRSVLFRRVPYSNTFFHSYLNIQGIGQGLRVTSEFLQAFVSTGNPIILNAEFFGDWDGQAGQSGLLYRIFKTHYSLEAVASSSLSSSPSPSRSVSSSTSKTPYPTFCFEECRYCTNAYPNPCTDVCIWDTETAFEDYLNLGGQCIGENQTSPFEDPADDIYLRCGPCLSSSNSITPSISPTPQASITSGPCNYDECQPSACTENQDGSLRTTICDGWCAFYEFFDTNSYTNGTCLGAEEFDTAPPSAEFIDCRGCTSQSATNSASSSISTSSSFSSSGSSSSSISISPSSSPSGSVSRSNAPPYTIPVNVVERGSIDAYLNQGGTVEHLQNAVKADSSWRKIYRRTPTVGTSSYEIYEESSPVFVNTSSMWTIEGATYSSGVELVALRRLNGSDPWFRTLIHSGCRKITTFDKHSSSNEYPGDSVQTIDFAANNLVPFRGYHLCQTHDILGENHLQILTVMYNPLSQKYPEPSLVYYSFFEGVEVRSVPADIKVTSLQGRLRSIAVSDVDGNGLQDIVILQETELDSLRIMYTYKSLSGVVQQYVPITIVDAGNLANVYSSIALCPPKQNDLPNLYYTDQQRNWKFFINLNTPGGDQPAPNLLCELYLPQCSGRCSATPFPRCLCSNQDEVGNGITNCATVDNNRVPSVTDEFQGGTPVCADSSANPAAFCQNASYSCNLFREQLREDFLLLGERPFEQGVFALECPVHPYNNQSLFLALNFQEDPCQFQYVGTNGSGIVIEDLQIGDSIPMEQLLQNVVLTGNFTALFVEERDNICNNLRSLLLPGSVCPVPWTEDTFRDFGDAWCVLPPVFERSCFGGVLECTENEDLTFDCRFPDGPSFSQQAQLSCASAPIEAVLPSSSCAQLYPFCTFTGNPLLEHDRGCPEPFAWNSQKCTLNQTLQEFSPCRPHTDLGCTPSACVITDSYNGAVEVVPNPLRYDLIQHIEKYTSDVAYWDTTQAGKVDERQGNLTRSALFCSLLSTTTFPLYTVEESCPHLVFRVESTTLYIFNRTVECVRQENELYTCWSLTVLHGSALFNVRISEFTSLCFIPLEPCIQPSDAEKVPELGSCVWESVDVPVQRVVPPDRRTESSITTFCDSGNLTQASCTRIDTLRGYNCSVTHSQQLLWWCILPLLTTEPVCSSLAQKCRLGLQPWTQRLVSAGEYMLSDPRTFRSFCQDCVVSDGLLCPVSSPSVCADRFCESTGQNAAGDCVSGIDSNANQLVDVDRVCGPEVVIHCSFHGDDLFLCSHRENSTAQRRQYMCSVPTSVVFGNGFCTSFQDWCLYENRHKGLTSGCLANQHENPLHFLPGELAGAYCLVPVDSEITLWWPVSPSNFWCQEEIFPETLRNQMSITLHSNESWELEFSCGETSVLCSSLGTGACEDFLCKTRCQLNDPPELNCFEIQRPFLKSADGLEDGCTIPFGALTQERNLQTCEALLDQCTMMCATNANAGAVEVDSTYCNAQIIPTEEFECYGEILVCSLEFPDGFEHFYRCVQGDSVTRFTMDCLVETRLVENQEDVCAALTGLCREDIVCAEGFLKGENEKGLCGVEPPPNYIEADGQGSDCTCDLHWAPEEIAMSAIPVSLVDTQRYTGLGTDEILTLVAPQSEEVLLENLEVSHSLKQKVENLIAEEHSAFEFGEHAYGLSCHSRGYLSIPEFFLSVLTPVVPNFEDRYKLLLHFLRGTDPFRYSLQDSDLMKSLETAVSAYLFNTSLYAQFPGENYHSVEIITGPSFRATKMEDSPVPTLQPWKLYWCLEASGKRPQPVQNNLEQLFFVDLGAVRPTCAVRPGKHLPLCTTQCPVGWKLDVHAAIGTCFSPEGAACVLGATDPFVQDRDAGMRVCPPNLYAEYTALPVKIPGEFHRESLQWKDLCNQHSECSGISFAYGGVFFSKRRLNYPLSGLESLNPSKYGRQHKLSTEQQYFLHPVGASDLLYKGEALVQYPDWLNLAENVLEDTEQQTGSFASYSLSKAAGQKNCTTPRFDWRYPFQATSEGHPLHTHRKLGEFSLRALKERVRVWFIEELENSTETENLLQLWEEVETLAQLRGFLRTPHWGMQEVTPSFAVDVAYESARTALILREVQDWASEFAFRLSFTTSTVAELSTEEEDILPCFMSSMQECGWQPDPQFYAQRTHNLELEGINSYWEMTTADSEWLARSEAGAPTKSGVLQRMKHIASVGLPYASYDILSNYWPSFGSMIPVSVTLNKKLFLYNLLRHEELDVIGDWGVHHLHPLPSTVDKIEFLTLDDVVAYHSWHNWEGVFRHALHGFNRISSSPESCPEIQHPLWAFLPAEQQQCVQPLCPLSLVQDIDWFDLDTSLQEQENAAIYPDPALTNLPRNEQYGFPCSMQGWCDTTKPLGEAPLAETFRGSCRCFPDFEVAETMDLGKTVTNKYGQRRVFSSLRSDSCELDIRGTCSVSLLEDVTATCGNKGQCVVDFEAGFQKGTCDCGSFPSVLQEAEGGALTNAEELLAEEGFAVRFSCTDFPKDHKNYCLNLESRFIDNGYTSTQSRYPEQCLVPPEGCVQNNVQAWGSQFHRLSRGTYERQESFGCTLPRRNALGIEDGACVKDGDQYSCVCREGRYGKYCEHVTLAGRCFDASKTDLLAYNCVWNSYLHQFEPFGIHISEERDQGLYPSFLCGGLACSGHGSCVHNNMLNTEEIRGKLAPIVGFSYDLSWQELVSSVPAFRASMFQENVVNSTLLGSALEQYCVCDEGRGGQFCQERLCTNPECFVQEFQFCTGITEKSSVLQCSCPLSVHKNSCWRPRESYSPHECICKNGKIRECDTGGDFKLIKIEEGPPVIADCVCKDPNKTISIEGTCVQKVSVV